MAPDNICPGVYGCDIFLRHVLSSSIAQVLGNDFSSLHEEMKRIAGNAGNGLKHLATNADITPFYLAKVGGGHTDTVGQLILVEPPGLPCQHNHPGINGFFHTVISLKTV